jgi:O-antigen ligase
MAALIAPVVLIVGLALAGGGFDVSTRHIAGLGVWLLVVALLVLGTSSATTLGRPFFWTVALIGGLALLSALSSFWSGSVELSVIEADRVLVYLGFFLAAFLIAQTSERRQRFAEGLAISVALIALLGLTSRLLPHLLEVSNSLGNARQSYPLGYWNANGAVCGIAIALLLWMSRHASWKGLRWASVAAMPAVLLTLYFTYSRGGLLALAVSVVCLLALSRDRLWQLGTLAGAAIGVVPAILAVQARHSLANNLPNQASVDQGVTVLLILLAGTAFTLLVFAVLRRIERRDGPLTGKALEASRSPAVLRGIALAAAAVAIGVAIFAGGRAWHQFSSRDLYFPENNPEQHFSQASGAGRHDFWRVAIDAFDEDPVLGHGAGTYVFSWQQLRSIELPVHDAHSLYLEAFAELGAVGGLMVLALVGTLLWCAFSAWRAAPHPQRELYAVLLAAMLAFAVGAAFDWFWEIPGLGAVFFLAAGVMVAVRCAQLAPSHRALTERASGRRYGLAVAGLAVAWIAAIALVGPLLVDRELKSSQSAAAEGNFAKAVDHASTARSIEPWAASPYVQLGQLAEIQGDYPTAIADFTDAIEREEDNWQWYYWRSKAEHESGSETAALKDLEHARRLNPLNPEAKCLQEEGWSCG